MNELRRYAALRLKAQALETIGARAPALLTDRGPRWIGRCEQKRRTLTGRYSNATSAPRPTVPNERVFCSVFPDCQHLQGGRGQVLLWTVCQHTWQPRSCCNLFPWPTSALPACTHISGHVNTLKKALLSIKGGTYSLLLEHKL